MAMLLKDASEVGKDLLDHLQDPEFNDVKIEATDGEVPANKAILSMRSQYFRSMFSVNNNFVESSTGKAKLPYPKSVVEKAVIYLYSGEMSCDGMDLRSLLGLLELLNLMNLESKYEIVEAFTKKNITAGKYPLTDCLKTLDVCSKMGLQSVADRLLIHLGRNFNIICEEKEVGELSWVMFGNLLMQVENKEILRIKTLAHWLTVNNMEMTEKKDEILKFLGLNLEIFTHRELASSDVRKSGLYDLDKIFERMDQLFEERETKIRQMTEDMITVKDKTSHSHWYGVFPADLTKRYAGL